ncbi:hypothetical protein HMPREF1861_01146 [Corynebacterium kroppenstedtii]|nr:hypothetical protein HMPREF1861_01146 [Corynebacterium kroppenstedtii]
MCGPQCSRIFDYRTTDDVDPVVTSTISLGELPHRLEEVSAEKNGRRTVAVL